MSVLQWLTALVALGAVAGCVLAWRRWRADQRELARVRGTFARYVAPSVVDVLLARKDERLFTGRAVRATVLVCRIRNFAHFIEPLSPEQTLRYLNEFYGLAGTAVQRHRGIIDSFLGDGIVAVFGVPLDNPTQEDDALQAALALVRHVVAMRKRWEKQHRKPFTIGIGINTGEMIAGDAGFRDRREFTVVGSEATFAHRLQEAAFALNAFVVASRATCESLATEYQLVPVSGVPLPGVRRLLDAFVVRARVRGAESFTVPSDAMIETTIEPAAAPAANAPADSAPPHDGTPQHNGTALRNGPASRNGTPARNGASPARNGTPRATESSDATTAASAPNQAKAPPSSAKQSASSAANSAPTAAASAAPSSSAARASAAPSPSGGRSPDEQELPVARPRPRAAANGAAPRAPLSDLGLPELKHGWMFPQDDAKPILPEPPAPRATYEDRGGSFDL